MKRIDRRALFASGAAAALLAATGSFAAQQPRRGGVLRLAVPRDGGFLERVAQGAMFDQLTEVAPDGVLRAELATAWRCDESARHWTFDLRPDATFHDGAPVVAQDVVASLAAHVAANRLLLAGGAVFRAEGDHLLHASLDEGDAQFPYVLATAGVFIAPKGRIDVDLQDAVGSGLYRVERAQAGRHFRASRVADHFKDGTAGWFDAVEVIVIPDAQVRAEALRDGFVDVAAWPAAEGLIGRGAFAFHPSQSDMALAAGLQVSVPRRVSPRAELDDTRIAQRWWMV